MSPSGGGVGDPTEPQGAREQEQGAEGTGRHATAGEMVGQ